MRDHDDTLWWTAIHADQLKWPKFKVVLADETQDFNRDQLIMLKKLAEQGARVIAVGDPNQAIYRFRGADAKSFTNIENMLKSLPNSSTTHDLPVNFRSGTEIINFANQNTHVKGLQAGKHHAGLVTTNKTHDDAMDKINSEWKANGKLKHQTAFIARTNAPLVNTAIELLKNNMNFTIIGRDFSDELVKFIENIVGKNRYDIEDFVTEMNDYVYQKEEAWHGKANKEDDLKELKQTSEAMSSVIDYLQSNNWKDPKTGIVVRTHKDFIYLLRKLFAGLNADENGADAKAFKNIDPRHTVVLSTAHRSKGLEFDRVYIKCPDLFERKANNEEDQQQEDNAKYVAFTRATHQLHVLDEKCQEKKKGRG
jgi:superfamily I DNA/RNA helicase